MRSYQTTGTRWFFLRGKSTTPVFNIFERNKSDYDVSDILPYLFLQHCTGEVTFGIRRQALTQVSKKFLKWCELNASGDLSTPFFSCTLI
jgi:hypothetical protein